MIRVGLTGGYATGKSFVAGELAAFGCHLIYADRLGHAVLEPGGEAYAATIALFGPDILATEGTIDRKKLGAVVFGAPDLLEQLNRIVHPAVIRLEEGMSQRFSEQDPQGIVVTEAAILIETGRYKAFDRIILTSCSEEIQIRRAMARDKATREQVLSRLARQMPLAEKMKYADYIIDTGGEKESTRQQVRVVYENLHQLAEASVA